MGEPAVGTFTVRAVAASLVVALLLVAALAALPGAGSASSTGDRSSYPDLVPTELCNLTPVWVGELVTFNITIRNTGTAAYLVRTMGELEAYAYRDSETSVVDVYKVFDDIYIGRNHTSTIEVRFDTLGTHSLTVVVDEFDRVPEQSESNNKISTTFEVVPAPVNRAPEADGGNDRSGYVGKRMLFSGEFSRDIDGDQLEYYWDFGDGRTGTGRWTNHTYTEMGEFSASLMVSDGSLSDWDYFTVTITEPPQNNPPTAHIYSTRTEVAVNEEVTLDSSGSSDPDPGDELDHDWDYDASNGVDDWVRGLVVRHSWPEAGTYTVTLRVSDGIDSATTTKTITVTAPVPENIPPTANAGPDKGEVEQGQSVTFSGHGQDGDGSIATYEWDLDGDGSYDTYSETDGTLVHVFREEGIHTLWLKVTDDRGGVATDSVVVTVKASDGGDDESPGLTAVFSMIALVAASLAATVSRRGE